MLFSDKPELTGSWFLERAKATRVSSFEIIHVRL